MSIANRIQAINDHLIDDYKVLRLAGADLSGVNKNILNLKQSWQERLLYFMREGTQVVWNNWNKVTGSGTTLSLNNTEEAPMSLTYKGNTSQSGTPTPTSPIPVQVVSGDNSIKVEGKNLIPITYAKIKSSNTSGSWNNNVYSYNGLTFTVNEDLSVVINGTASGNTAFNLIGTTNLFVDINISNGNYVLSGSTGGEQNMSTWGIYMAIKHSDNTTETQFCYNGDLAFTKVEGDTFFPVIRIGSGTVCNNIEIKPMIRKSGTNSTYQPYTSSSYPISLGDKELCKIGTYQDKIFKNTPNTTDYDSNLEDNLWYLKKEIGKVVLNGSENWALNSSSGDSYRYWIRAENFTPVFDNCIVGGELNIMGDLLCNRFTQVVFSSTAIGKFSINNTSGNNWFLLNSSETSVENFKTWLGTHNTIAYYVLNTPTYDKITDTTLISQLEAMKQSYDSQTNISQTNNDLPFELNITALSNE